MWAIVLMNERVTREERLQSLGEEIANSVSAGAGLIAAIAGIPLLLAFATQRGSNWTVAGALVFAATTVWLYLASTVYHALPRNRAKRLFRLFDPHGNLSSDCRNLHTVHSRCASRDRGLDAFCRSLELGYSRDSIHSSWRS